LLLVVALSRIPRRVVAVNGIISAWRYQVASLLLWLRNARLDTASPKRLAEPADATGNPGHNLVCEEGSTEVGGQVLLHQLADTAGKDKCAFHRHHAGTGALQVVSVLR
jgi:hypothetical protein